jgi:hypothetical protein
MLSVGYDVPVLSTNIPNEMIRSTSKMILHESNVSVVKAGELFSIINKILLVDKREREDIQ